MRLDRRLPLGSHTDSKTKGETVCKDSFGATAEFLYATGTARQPHTTRELPSSIPLSVETHTLRPSKTGIVGSWRSTNLDLVRALYAAREPGTPKRPPSGRRRQREYLTLQVRLSTQEEPNDPGSDGH